jgi:outer membrane protein insertion porin family
LGSNYRDVYIEVEETPTGNISLFAGVSSTDNVFGGLDLTERNFNIEGVPSALFGQLSNLRGGGEYMHMKGTLGVNQNSVLLSWMNPYVNDSLWRLGVELSRTFSEEQKHTRVVTYGGSVWANYPISTYWTAGTRQRLRHTRDTLEFHSDTATPQSVQEMKDKLEQHGLISAFSVNLNYDSTDSAYKPHRGIRSYLEAEVAGVGGNYDFGKFSYINTAYVPVWRKGTLKFRGDFKYIYPFGKTSHQLQIPYSERLFLGGETTIRGYKPFSVGPLVELTNAQGGTIVTETPLGGISSILFSAEYNQEIFRMLDIFAFFDVGSVTTGRFTFNQFRPTIGGGVRIDIGNRSPIMVGYGYPLDKKDRIEQKWQKVFFQMGAQF